MGYPPREDLAGILQHVVVKGINGNQLFHWHSGFLHYQSLVRKVAQEERVLMYGFVLMHTHAHFLFESSEDGGISRVMQTVNSLYARLSNRWNQRSGPVFRRRFWAETIDSNEYFLQCLLYIESNPSRAGITTKPEQYPYSSCRYHFYGEKVAGLAEHVCYKQLAASAPERQSLYRGYITHYLSSEYAPAVVTPGSGRVELG